MLLVFGMMLRLPVRPCELPEQKESMDALYNGRAEMEKLIARTRIHTAATKNVPTSADSNLNIGDMCLIYRDSPKNTWVSPYLVIDVNINTVTVIAGGRASVLSIDKCKKYIPPSPENNAPLLAKATLQEAVCSPTYNDDPNYGIDNSYRD